MTAADQVTRWSMASAVLGLVAVVAALTAGAVMIPFGVMSRREPALAW